MSCIISIGLLALISAGADVSSRLLGSTYRHTDILHSPVTGDNQHSVTLRGSQSNTHYGTQSVGRHTDEDGRRTGVDRCLTGEAVGLDDCSGIAAACCLQPAFNTIDSTGTDRALSGSM